MKTLSQNRSEPGAIEATRRIRPEILDQMRHVPRRQDTAEPERPAPAREPGPGLEATRSTLAKIDFLPPEQAVVAASLAGDLPAGVKALCREALAVTPDAVAAALLALGRETRTVKPRPRRSLEAMIMADVASDGDVHDHFFNIRRAQTMKPAVFVESILEALAAFRQDIEEAPVTVEPEVLSSLETGLVSVLGTTLGEPLPRRPRPVPPRKAAPAADYPARRWIRGHQIFAALTQGLIVAMTRLGAAMDRGSGVDEAVEQIVTGLTACAAALVFTADFPIAVYDAEIRPAMCPPHLPRGFSGLLSADHRHLVRLMKEMKPRMDGLRLARVEAHRAIVAALSDVYDRHKLVCARFVGADRPSLLMMSEAGESGPHQLERFKAMRIRDLG